MRFTGQRHFAVGTCSPPNTKTLADDGPSRVYEERYVYDPVVRDFSDDGNGAVIYGCNRATHRRWVLAGDDSNSLFDYYNCAEYGGPAAVAGRYMAVVVDWACEPGVGYGFIRVVDLKSGTVRLDRAALVQHGNDFDPHAGNNATSLVLAPTGSAAWILCRAMADHPPCEVVDEIALGPNTLLDEGAEIDHKSLTLHGSTLSWRNGGETKTAMLG